MALDSFDFKPEAKLQDFTSAANLSAQVGDSKMVQGKQDPGNSMPREFAPNGNDLTLVDDSLAKSMKTAESMLSPEAKARVEKEAAVPYNAIKAAGEQKEPMLMVAQKGDTYWGIAEILLSSRTGNLHPSNKEINSMVKDMAAINDKPGDKVNHLRAGEYVRLPLRDR
jgi:hypothetical protein